MTPHRPTPGRPQAVPPVPPHSPPCAPTLSRSRLPRYRSSQVPCGETSPLPGLGTGGGSPTAVRARISPAARFPHPPRSQGSRGVRPGGAMGRDVPRQPPPGTPGVPGSARRAYVPRRPAAGHAAGCLLFFLQKERKGGGGERTSELTRRPPSLAKVPLCWKKGQMCLLFAH